MKCKNCQLVEMARVQREGRADVYRCPKCGQTKRVQAREKAMESKGQRIER